MESLGPVFRVQFSWVHTRKHMHTTSYCFSFFFFLSIFFGHTMWPVGSSLTWDWNGTLSSESPHGALTTGLPGNYWVGFLWHLMFSKKKKTNKKNTTQSFSVDVNIGDGPDTFHILKVLTVIEWERPLMMRLSGVQFWISSDTPHKGLNI